jgi:hypothetical protein
MADPGRRPGRWAALLCAVVLAACASRPASPPAAAPPAPAPEPAALISDPWAAPLEAFEQRQRDAAAVAARQGHWLEAAWAWEVLAALNPRDAAIERKLAEARAAAAAVAAERVARARQSQQRGDTEAATRLYVEALAQVPALPEAVEALRAIERDRIRRQHLGQVSRYTLLRRSDPPGSGSNGSSAAPERAELEHATILANQGELDGAIGVLKPLAQGAQGDPAAKKLLADLYVKRADSLAASDRPAAIAALEMAVAADPSHPRAATRLKLLRDAAKRDPAAATPAAAATAPQGDERKERPKTPEAAKAR